ncbi:MAG TPA: response regulator [Terriglobales bacterium]|nr:response regulator [Terriglobales bacterium]
MTTTYPTSKRLMLCISDDPAIVCYEQALLERAGHGVLTASSAHQALRLVAMCRCDAVLLECEMPAWSGYAVASQIKRLSPDVTIVLLSSSEIPTHPVSFADAVVPKLEASQQLLPIIADLCNRNHDSQEIQARFREQDQR